MDEEPRKEAPPETFKRVYLGQIIDPLVPPHPDPPESPEDELTRLALEDPQAQEPPPRGGPTLWRLIALVVFAVVALGIVFWWNP